MNEKKLKKLSRLELLELLFEVSKENEQLREENGEIKRLLENNTADSRTADSLVSGARAIEDAVSEIKKISEMLSLTADGNSVLRDSKTSDETVQTALLSQTDAELFYGILKLFRQKPFLISVLPEELKGRLRDRLDGI